MGTSGCRPVMAGLDAYADGELAPDQVLEIEAHLAECHSCSGRLELDHAVRKSLRRATYASAVPSDALRERIEMSLRAEAGRVEALEQAENRPSMLSWGNIVPLAAAAAFALLWTGTADQKATHPGSSVNHATLNEPFNVEKLLDDIVERHLDRTAPAVTEPALLSDLAPDVGVPVHAPSLVQYGARWEGGSVVPLLRDQHAALLRYRLDGHRMTLYVFNAERFPLGDRFKKRVVRDEPVYVAWKRGFAIAATDRHGVGYAVASDLGEDEGAEIVASLR